MANKVGDNNGGDLSMGTDAWNVADGYTKIKILLPLISLDKLDTIAQFGTEVIGDDQFYTDNQLNKRRVEALQRFEAIIKQLLGNVKFAMKKADHPHIDRLVTRVKNTEPYLNESFKVTEDAVTHEELFKINEVLFKKILDILQSVKDELNTPLNNAGLIFRPTEEVDLDKIMSDIVESG
jgi:hypothetical protein